MTRKERITIKMPKDKPCIMKDITEVFMLLQLLGFHLWAPRLVGPG